MAEKDIQRQILEYLQLRQLWHWRNNTGAVAVGPRHRQRFIRFGSPGMPDITVRSPGGKVIWIEVKSAGKKLTTDQEAWRHNAIYHGDIFILAYTLDDVRKVIG